MRPLAHPSTDNSSVGGGSGTGASSVSHSDGGLAGPASNVTAGNLADASPFPSPALAVNSGGGAVGIAPPTVTLEGDQNRQGSNALPPRSATSLQLVPPIDPGAPVDVTFVAKSFINGVNPVGSIIPDWSPGLTDPIPDPWNNLVSPFGTVTSATARLGILAGLVGWLDAFNEDPQTDAKDHHMYRLFTRVDASWDCDGDRIYNLHWGRDTDGGNELPFIDGTIKMDRPVFTMEGDSTITIRWMGYGHPNPIVEPGMQWVAFRSSVNIWHEPTVYVKCAAGQKSFGEIDFVGSRFPSHRLWINGTQVDEDPQGWFSDLWTPSSWDPTFVA